MWGYNVICCFKPRLKSSFDLSFLEKKNVLKIINCADQSRGREATAIFLFRFEKPGKKIQSNKKGMSDGFLRCLDGKDFFEAWFYHLFPFTHTQKKKKIQISILHPFLFHSLFYIFPFPYLPLYSILHFLLSIFLSFAKRG